jgi:hypothetical protein
MRVVIEMSLRLASSAGVGNLAHRAGFVRANVPRVPRKEFRPCCGLGGISPPQRSLAGWTSTKIGGLRHDDQLVDGRRRRRFIVSSPGFAQDKASQKFLKEAIEGNLAEVKMGELAQKNGQSDKVRSFGQMLQKDHSDANQKATAAANQLGMSPPTEPNKKQTAIYDRMSKLSGDKFDPATECVDRQLAGSQGGTVARAGGNTCGPLSARLDLKAPAVPRSDTDHSGRWSPRTETPSFERDRCPNETAG